MLANSVEMLEIFHPPILRIVAHIRGHSFTIILFKPVFTNSYFTISSVLENSIWKLTKCCSSNLEFWFEITVIILYRFRIILCSHSQSSYSASLLRYKQNTSRVEEMLSFKSECQVPAP